MLFEFDLLTKIFIIIWLHFITDFVLQSNRVGTGKSKNIGILLLHCLIYSIPFFIFGITFGLVTFLSHFIVDFISSKITTYFWQREERHWFFVTIGWDQAIHMSCFMLMLKYNL